MPCLKSSINYSMVIYVHCRFSQICRRYFNISPLGSVKHLPDVLASHLFQSTCTKPIDYNLDGHLGFPTGKQISTGLFKEHYMAVFF